MEKQLFTQIVCNILSFWLSNQSQMLWLGRFGLASNFTWHLPEIIINIIVNLQFCGRELTSWLFSFQEIYKSLRQQREDVQRANNVERSFLDSSDELVQDKFRKLSVKKEKVFMDQWEIAN